MCKKCKTVCYTLNNIEHFVILGSTITGWVSISAIVCFVGIPIGITSSIIGLKICAITAAIKKYKSIIFFFIYFFYIYMNIVLTNKYNKKLQSPGALIKETPGYKQKDNLKNNK